MLKGFLSFDEFINEALKEDKLFEASEYDKKVGFIKLSRDIAHLDGGTEGRQHLLNTACLSKLFIHYGIKEDFNKNLKVSNEIPYIYYGGFSEKSRDFLKKNKINYKNLYNKPDDTEKSGSKIEFAKIFKDKSWLPKTVFKREDAINGDVGFPVICKISNGHSGLGIKKIDTKKELENEPKTFELDGEKREYDIYCQFIDFDKEYRCMFVKDKCFIVNERVTTIKNEKSIRTKKVDEKIDFIYVEQDFKKIPETFINKVTEIAKEIRKEIPLEIWALDVVVDKNGDFYVMETSSATGLGAAKMCLAYIAIYEDYYKKDLPQWYKDDLMKNFISQSYLLYWSKYKKEIESSPWRLDYEKIAKEYKEVDEKFYKNIIKNENV